MIGTLTELILLGHIEGWQQFIPVGLLSFSLILYILHSWLKASWIWMALRIMFTLCILSGLLGTFFHLRSNLDFEKEMYPSMDASTLLLESLSGAIPALAPGSMIVVGLVGFLYLMNQSNIKYQ
jgi:hypothetical protein